jgi:hypothetical protein
MAPLKIRRVPPLLLPISTPQAAANMAPKPEIQANQFFRRILQIQDLPDQRGWQVATTAVVRCDDGFLCVSVSGAVLGSYLAKLV